MAYKFMIIIEIRRKHFILMKSMDYTFKLFSGF